MDNELANLFRREYTKMVAVLAHQFGLQHLDIAEDLVADTFLVAAETWGVRGLPPNPPAWLYKVAKQKALYHFRRGAIFDRNVRPALMSSLESVTEFDFSPQHIQDSQLQMVFAVCNPAIASEAQIGLALRILCGFGIDEIAEAFLTKKETINKRLYRAREALRAQKAAIELPAESEMEERLDNVLRVIYLLFNEGYYSSTQDELLRKDFCLEAMRLGLLVAGYERTNQPRARALVALMCFHASRFDARRPGVLYEEQDESLWDRDLIHQGRLFLQSSMEGDQVSSYHVEAMIASWHCQKEDTPEKWNEILGLYDQLLAIRYSPVIALNRGYALYKVKGPRVALEEVERLNWETSPLYFLLLGELYRTVDPSAARSNLEKALSLARSDRERRQIQDRIDKLRFP